MVQCQVPTNFQQLPTTAMVTFTIFTTNLNDGGVSLSFTTMVA